MKKASYLILATTLFIGAWLLTKKSDPTNVIVPTIVEGHVQIASTQSPLSIEEKTAPAAITIQTVDEAFTKQLTEIEQSLPTLEQSRKLKGEETHHAPREVLEGGKSIGRLLEAAQAQPKNREASLKMLLRCAEKNEVVPSIRAVCWKSLMEKIPEWNLFVPVADAKVPTEIKILATKL